MTLMFYMSYLISLVGVLLCVAFFTLMERKMMGLMHYRKGPNKTLMTGILQPISDATKLLTKENVKLMSTKKTLFLISPMMAMAIMLICWAGFDFQFSSMSKSNKEIFIILSVMGLSPFVFLYAGWGSNSKYALLGSYRAIAQIISYEVCLLTLILFLVYTQKSFSWNTFKLMQENYMYAILSFPMFVAWLTICLSETNRTPFDHAESESELVSGFNIEYGGGMFAVIFIAEYGMILFMSYMTTILFIGSALMTLKCITVAFTIIWVRCSLPRLRYDKLMMTCWKIFLPYSLAALATALLLS